MGGKTLLLCDIIYSTTGHYRQLIAVAKMCCIDFETIGSVTLKWFQIIFPLPTERSAFTKTLIPCLSNVCNVYKNLFKDIRCHHQCFNCAFNAFLLYLIRDLSGCVNLRERYSIECTLS